MQNNHKVWKTNLEGEDSNYNEIVYTDKMQQGHKPDKTQPWP